MLNIQRCECKSILNRLLSPPLLLFRSQSTLQLLSKIVLSGLLCLKLETKPSVLLPILSGYLLVLRLVAQYDQLLLGLLPVAYGVELSEKPLRLNPRTGVLERLILEPLLVLLRYLSCLDQIRVQVRRVVLEDEIQCGLHLLGEEAVEIGFELVSLGLV